jgi:hypothetical protein
LNLRQTISAIFLVFGLFIIASAQTPKTEAPPVQPRASIKGRVITEDGETLAGITITAIPFGRGAANRPGGGQSTQTTSDDEGYFEIAGLTPASYSLFAAVPGYITAPPDENHQAGFYHPGEGVTLTLIKGGVITGKVINAAGEPLTGINVNTIPVSSGDAQAFNPLNNFNRSFRTDDLGVYRIYGLAPGNYLVQASGRGGGFGPPSGNQEVPTFYPSAVREGATPVAVYAGFEASGIDIRYRGDRGYAVSGKVLAEKSANADNGFGMTQVVLLSAGTDLIVASDRAMGGPMGRGPFGGNAPNSEAGFAFYGVADGEYDVLARRNGSDSESISAPRRITVRGANVSGIELTLTPLASLSGRVVLEKQKAPACRAPRLAYLSEMLVRVLRDDAKPPPPLIGHQRFVAPDQQGQFMLRGLAASRYRLTTELPSPLWYLRAVQLEKPVSATNVRKTASDPVKDGLLLKAGERVSGLVVTVAEGAANVQGKHHAKTLIHLIPAETEAADNLLRYSQTQTRDDGSYRFTNFAPGKYWLLAQPAPAQPNVVAWQSAARLNLRRLAETGGTLIELQPCQQLTAPALGAAP